MGKEKVLVLSQKKTSINGWQRKLKYAVTIYVETKDLLNCIVNKDFSIKNWWNKSHCCTDNKAVIAKFTATFMMLMPSFIHVYEKPQKS